MLGRLFLKSFTGDDGFLGVVRVRLRALSDAVLPPFTSRTAKSVMAKAPCLRELEELYGSRRAMRPVTVRLLKGVDGSPLYKVYSPRGGGEHVITVERGDELVAEYAFYAREPVSPFCQGEVVSIDYAVFELWTESAEVVSVGDLAVQAPSPPFRVEFVTPITITTKIMAPPVRPGGRLERVIRRAREAYRLLPTPGYLLSQAARQWLSIVKGVNPQGYPHPYALGRLGDVLIAEVDYRLRPVTVVYGSDGAGRTRLVRGVTGYVILQPLADEISDVAGLLLAFAEYMGLGKSRSIGFGEVRVSTAAEPGGGAPQGR